MRETSCLSQSDEWFVLLCHAADSNLSKHGYNSGGSNRNMRLTITALEENLRYKNIPSYVSLSFLNELSNIIYSVNFTLLPFSSSFCHIILQQRNIVDASIMM